MRSDSVLHTTPLNPLSIQRTPLYITYISGDSKTPLHPEDRTDALVHVFEENLREPPRFRCLATDPLWNAERMDYAATPRLVGELVVLRGQKRGDVAKRASLGRRAEIARAMGANIDEDLSMSRAAARRHLKRRFGRGPHWIIADLNDDFVGLVRLSPIDTRARTATFAIAIFDPERLGQGLGTEATRLAIAYGLDQLELESINLTVLADNHRAIAAYVKAGFVTERRIERSLRRGDEYIDDLVMTVTKNGQSHSGKGSSPDS